mmetsp:Transcript_6309/g.25564  ORF Transcript_6309/g.25564 Transcript_6309/m.25564 type:complete len:316 (-) Transcript_6309:2148-3095(-)
MTGATPSSKRWRCASRPACSNCAARGASRTFFRQLRTDAGQFRGRGRPRKPVVSEQRRARHGAACAQARLSPARQPIKPARMRPHRRQRRRVRAEPSRQFGAQLVGGGAWQPHAITDIVRPAQGQLRHATEQLAAIDAARRAANDEMVVAPGVVGAAAIAGKGAAEIAGGEQGHAVGQAEGAHRGVEGGDGGVDLGEVLRLALQLVVAMGVKAADGREEALARQAQHAARGDELGGHAELTAQLGVGEDGADAAAGERTGQHPLGLQAAAHQVEPGLLEGMGPRLGQRRRDRGRERIAAGLGIGVVEVETEAARG